MDNLNLPKLTDFNIPIPRIPEIKDHNLADGFHRRLCEYVIRFEGQLTENEELAVKLVSFGETVTIIVEDIGYWNPSLICFYGVSTSGQKVQLIQHVTQLSFLLIAAKSEKPVEAKERIGFKLRKEIDQKST
jgi:Family of unknown function (DUF6173)